MLARRRIEIDELRTSVEHDVRYANISIIEGIGASQYGIGMAAGHIAEAITSEMNAQCSRLARTIDTLASHCRFHA